MRLFLGVFCLASLFKAFIANDVLSELNAINYVHLIQKIDFDKIISAESNSKQNAVDAYDDSKCIQQFSELKRSYNESEMWAINVMDASGKTPSGILSGNTFSMGDFDQCLAVKHDIITNNEFYGQYCRMEIFLNISEMSIRNFEWRTGKVDIDFFEIEEHPSVTPRAFPSPSPTNSLTFGICGPATCSPTMLIRILTEALHQSDINYVSAITIAPISCQKQMKLKFQAEDIFAIKQTKSSSEISCLHGLRSLSMFWVLTSHLYDQFWAMPMSNANYMFEWITKYYSMVILSMNKAVDTFLFMSGLLLTLSMLKQLRNNNGKFNYAILYLHRYLRVTPLLAVCVVLLVTVYKYMGSGPYWPDFANNYFDKYCRRYWWSTLLYIQNYVNPTNFCLPHAWYLSADMQLYILSPPFIYLLYRYNNKIIPILVAFCVASSGVVIYFFMKHDFYVKLLTTAEGNQSNDLRRLLTYHPTHARAGSWIVGVIFGYILFRLDGKKVQLKKTILCLGWIVSVSILLASIFANYPLQQLDQEGYPLLKGLYHALPRIGWPMALAFIVFACHFGYGGIVNWFLSLPQWLPISRLTYSMYLIHVPIVLYLERTIRISRHFSDLNAFHSFFGHLILTIMIAFIFSLAFEYPVFVLEKLLIRKMKPAPEIEKTNFNDN